MITYDQFQCVKAWLKEQDCFQYIENTNTEYSFKILPLGGTAGKAHTLSLYGDDITITGQCEEGFFYDFRFKSLIEPNSLEELRRILVKMVYQK